MPRTTIMVMTHMPTCHCQIRWFWQRRWQTPETSLAPKIRYAILWVRQDLCTCMFQSNSTPTGPLKVTILRVISSLGACFPLNHRLGKFQHVVDIQPHRATALRWALPLCSRLLSWAAAAQSRRPPCPLQGRRLDRVP